jgi:hypothetical protein
MFEYSDGDYKFVGYEQGFIMVYRSNIHVDNFNVHAGISSIDDLVNEASFYLKVIKQKY